MRYISTRGKAPELSFEEVVLAGLATDGGLYVPKEWPQLSPQEIAGLAGLSYTALAERIFALFIGDALDSASLRRIIEESYAGFRHKAVAPLKQLGADSWLLELFHGPTLAFKDFALQVLGRLMDHILARRGEQVTIVGATSGDTGSAAIAGCAGRTHMRVFILHPYGRVSEVQRRQMTTVKDANITNLAVEGNFDDCQRLVKAMFNDSEFRNAHKLAAVNSINWARILAQIVYYFYAAVALGAPARAASFTVPTGNFGDIYAGYCAMKMGLPIRKLVIASNRNDILTRFFGSGIYATAEVQPSLSPSMDIQVSSNFERLLFDAYHGNSGKVAALMDDLAASGRFEVEPARLSWMKRHFAAAACDDDATRAVIAEIYRTTGELVDPHTAVGLHAAQACGGEGEGPMVTLATAHPAKFPHAVQAAAGVMPPLPAHLADLFAREEHYEVLPNRLEEIKKAIRSKEMA